MCDEHTEHSNEEHFKVGDLSRRGFSLMSAAALAACATSPENAKTVTEQEVEITTADGTMSFVLLIALRTPFFTILPRIPTTGDLPDSQVSSCFPANIVTGPPPSCPANTARPPHTSLRRSP